jgi:hypothetical protein
MLLIKADKYPRDILVGVISPFAIVPASRPDLPNTENVERANNLAVAARTNGFGVTVIEGQWAGSDSRELFVFVVGNESQVVGFVRKMPFEADATANCFLFRREDGVFVRENSDRSREACVMNDSGFTLPDGRKFQLVTAFTPAPYNTAWAHSQGINVGESLEPR